MMNTPNNLQKLLFLDFTKGVISETTYAEFRHAQIEGCRRHGHIFASCGALVPGQACLCGDTTYSPKAPS